MGSIESSPPVILVSANERVEEGIIVINSNYTRAVESAGGGCIAVPPCEHTARSLDCVLNGVDGVLLTGGTDVHPRFYGREPEPGLCRVHPGRDRFELELVNAAFSRRLPILGVCRGLQVIQVANGGELIQDLPRNRPGAVLHDQTAPKHEVWHGVSVRPGSLLASIFKDLIHEEKLMVNSIHHQAAKETTGGWVATAHAADGTIEAMEFPELPFALAVQWHPETLVEHLPLFVALVEAAKNYRELRR